MNKTTLVIKPGILSIQQYRLINQQLQDILNRCDEGTLDASVVTGSLESVRQGHRIVESLPNPDVLDLDADPFVPMGYTLVEHIKGGKHQITKVGNELFVDGETVSSWLSEESIKVRPLNANFLDWLLRSENQKFYSTGPYNSPKFCNTIYREVSTPLRRGCLGIRYHESRGRWQFYYCHHYMSNQALAAYGEM